MKTKQEIVENWLPRYTGLPLEKFGKYILLLTSTAKILCFSYRLIINHIRYDVRIFG